MTPRFRRIAVATAFGVLAPGATSALADAPVWAGETLSGQPCSAYTTSQGFGPFSYSNPRHREEHLPVVEQFHFSDEVRSLRGGINASHPLNDLEYTVRAFPDHHAALYAMVRYSTEERFAEESAAAWSTIRRGQGERPPAECYLQRAAAFAPGDHQVEILTGIFYHRVQHLEEAVSAYHRALELAPSSAEAHYNLGLVLLDLGRYSEALEHAGEAGELGYPIEGLQRRLEAHSDS